MLRHTLIWVDSLLNEKVLYIRELLDFRGKLECVTEWFVEYYNNRRYHESLDNLTPADVYFGKKRERLSMRNMIKHETLKMRRAYNLGKGGLKNICNL